MFKRMLPQEPNRAMERVKFELRAAGVKENQAQANPLRTGVHTRGYLPHVKRESASYFVTFRLADSLPREVLLKLQAERANRLTAFQAQIAASEKFVTTPPEPDILDEIERNYRRKLENYLDRGHGKCWLRTPDIAELVANALRFFEHQRYELKAWVVMPNHVHAVLWPTPNQILGEILQSWKRYTAREANKKLGCIGLSFWQPESFDHWIRNDAELARCCDYVVRNPVKARLCAAPEDWRWSSAWRGKRIPS